jgi:2-methylcitrate dehydratase PrpD
MLITAASRLADHFTSLTWENVPTDHAGQLGRFLFDYLGVALSGSQTATGRILGDFAVEQGGPEQASIIGRAERVSAVNAAFANAVSEHSIELDDIDELALFHYGPPVLSAALAVGQWQRSDGRAFLTAVLAGCEAMSRISRATNNALRNRGFHTTPTCGVFGAAVAAGLLLGLDRDQLTSALGLAGAQASGLMEMYGPSMQKRFNPGPAARNGVTAAILAKKGFTGADTILEGERGFGNAFAGGIDIDALLDGLGTAVPVLIEHKPYSAARPIHNAIDCALRIRSALGPAHSLGDIAGITVRRHPDWAGYHLNPAPQTFHEAQVSLPYAVAAAFTFGRALPQQFVEENLRREDLRALSALVTVEPDDTLARGVSCAMTVDFTDGSSETTVVDHPKGSIENPMTPADLREKFRFLTDGLLETDAAERVEEMIADLPNQANLDGLFDLLAVKA